MYCDQKTDGGGWTVFQKRRDGSVDFYRTWEDYKRGFGSLKGEFWLGLDKIHRLTVNGNNKLRVDLEDNLGNTTFAEYSSFTVASEQAKYKLSLRKYSGAFTMFIHGPTFTVVGKSSFLQRYLKVHLSIYLSIYLYIHTYIHICTYIYMYMYVHIYMYLY